jgi:hypothetical protein
MERYSTLSSEELFARHESVNGITPLTHGVWMFIKTYLIEKGFLDGFDGFVISVMNAGGSFLKYAKLRELYKDLEKRGRER